MKRYLSILACLALSACAYTHEPTMTSAPKDQIKYEQDLDECRDIAFQRGHDAEIKHKASLTTDQKVAKEFMGFMGGALGGYLAASSQAPDPKENPDYFKTPMEMTDECMLQRGYPVVIEE